MDFHLFEQLLLIFLVALGAVLLFWRLRVPTIVAYMAAGVAIGPHMLGWVDEPEKFSLVAELGVVFLLFSLGLEFSLPRMLSLRGPVFGLGGAQVAVTTTLFGLTVLLWGTTIPAAIVIAGALALSSTAIVTRELSALKRFDQRYAQLSVAVLLFQDLAAVVFLILVPVLAGGGDGSLGAQLGWALVKGVGLLVLLMAVGKWVLPPIYHEVASSRTDEIFVLTTLVIALLAAWLTHFFGLSMALGGFVIGMMLGESPFKHQIDSEIRPFKDVLLGLFFVTVGMAVDIEVVGAHWLRILVFTTGLLLLNILIVTGLARVMGEPRGSALRTGITLAQAGEFGLALLVIGVARGVLPQEQGSFIMAIAVLSMLAGPFMIRRADWLSERLLRLWPGGDSEQAEPSHLQFHASGHVIIGGYGRVGQTVGHLLRENGLPYIAIDSNAEVVRRRNLEGDNVVYGNCTSVDTLERCHVESARLAILTFRSPELAKRAITSIRERGIQTPIIVRCSESGDFAELVSLGASHIVPEMLEASLLIGTQVLTLLELPPEEVSRQINALRNPLG